MDMQYVLYRPTGRITPLPAQQANDLARDPDFEIVDEPESPPEPPAPKRRGRPPKAIGEISIGS